MTRPVYRRWQIGFFFGGEESEGGRRLLAYGGGFGYAQAACGMHIRLRRASMCSATRRLARIRCSFLRRMGNAR